ncbi:MAG TPA: DUF885 domain-containing protein [Steroidobacteraceae bacterium]
MRAGGPAGRRSGTRRAAVNGFRCAAVLLAASCAGSAYAAQSPGFAAFLQSVYEQDLADSPQLATEVGSSAGNDRWDDRSEAAQAVRAASVRARLEQARSRFAHAQLDPAGELQYRVFLDEQRLLLARYRWRDHFYALNQIVGLHIDVPGLLAQQPLRNEPDANAYIRRIRAVRPAFRQLVQHMQAQAARGIFIPKSVYPLLIEEARNVISGAPHEAGPDSPILADFTRRIALLGIAAERKQHLIAAARTALRADLQPAYQQLIAVLQDEQQRTPIDGGVWQLPDGDAFYAFLVRQFTTTDLTPAQIHAMGLSEMTRVQAEIAALMSRIGFKGSVREFMAHVKADPHNFVSNDAAGREAFLARARAIVAAMAGKVTQAFYAPAPLPLRIERTPLYKEASSPPGFYESGSADGSRPGTVYLNLANMQVMPLNELEDLLYHEGIPGHHMQIATILADPTIPKLRKVSEWWQDSAFVEGWGLYAERLGKDLGFYRDPYSEFGLLSGELWRASRLVVDSGLHYKRWTRAQAIQYLDDNTPSPHASNVRAVDRYLAVPGQATSFTVGMHQFVAERERARQALGPRFDLREYHRIALDSGYIPLWALHDKVSAWIKSAPVTGRQPAFARLLEDYWQDYLRLNPLAALSEGDTRYESEFDDSLEEGWRQQMLAMLDHFQQASAAYAPAALSANDRTSLAMLRETLATARQFYSGKLFETARRLPIDQFMGLHTRFATDAAGSGDYPFKTPADYDGALQRADHYARWTDDAIARLREGIATHVVLPRMVVQRILPQLSAHFGKPAEQTEFWRPIAAMPATFGQADRARFETAYRQKITTVIEPAYERLYAFLQHEYLAKARDTVGLGQMPGGTALYEYDVREHTTTRLTPAQIHALGIAEVQRIETQFAQVQRQLGFTGTLAEFFAKVRTDRAQKFTSREQIVPAFDAALQRVIGTLPKLFDVMPHARFEIRALPDSARQSQGNGYYARAAADGSRPGILWINTYAPGVSDRFNVMTLVLHEGLPGHHFQTSIAQEQTDLPSFRRFDFRDAYGEGWALYAESLGTELGVFDDPWYRYGQLNYSILRANRLVIDTGLHAMEWDLDRGIRWMMQHSSMTREQAAAEVERYVADPGQALAYKIGELKIRELRQRAEQALGPKFDVRAFHDQILLGGSMPLTILEQNVNRWISASTLR